MIDLDDLCPPAPSKSNPRAHRVTFERHRRDRFHISSVVWRWFPGDMIGTKGGRVLAVQDGAYFEAFDAWWAEQDADRPAAERFREFVTLYAAGEFEPGGRFGPESL